MSFVESTPHSSVFPPDFVWGVATSAFQIEGAATADGKGPSTWDAFCKVPGVIADASNGDMACDHYNKWETDLDIIADLGVNAYRFSISWPRVRPSGDGEWNMKGIGFYDRLIDGLLARGLQPYVTLNHWDLPNELQLQGGWVNRNTVHRFVEYAREMGRCLGDRVKSITTHNEPWVVATLGYDQGIFAPGIKNRAAAAQSSHHLLLSHGLALQALRADAVNCELGIVLNLSPMHPASNDQIDLERTKLEDGRLLRWYMDPLFGKGYPDDVLNDLKQDAPKVVAGDMETIATKMDFLGINYYSRSVISSKGAWDVRSGGREITDMGWEIYPEGLTELLIRLNNDYDVPPMYITENGGAFKDALVDGRVHDTHRKEYISRHIAAMGEAMSHGVKMAGYMVWSLLDNFEWAFGYEKRFGIVHVDYNTQKRTLKDSALWYRSFLSQARASGRTAKPAVGSTQSQLADLAISGV